MELKVERWTAIPRSTTSEAQESTNVTRVGGLGKLSQQPSDEAAAGPESSNVPDNHECHRLCQGGNGSDEGGAPSKEGRKQVRRELLSAGGGQGALSEETGEPNESVVSEQPESQFLSDSMGRYFEKCSQDLAPKTFQDLIQKKRTLLLEVACSPESRLSAEVQKQAGYKEAAVRCSHWNNFDLETGGVKGVIQMIETLEPQKVWISPVCGPYSPLQSINQRTQQQIADLQEKRRRALKQYIGAGCVFQHCIQKGIHVSWEWSERCQGWRLPFMQELQKKYQPFISVTHGCRVNLRCPKTHGLLQKGWKIMTTHQHIADLLDRRCNCPKGYRHAKCEGGLASMTSYYTEDFVKLVCKGLFQELTLPLLRRELEGRENLPPKFGYGTFCVCDQLKHHECHLSCGSCCVYSHEKQESEHAMVQQQLVKEKSVEEIQRKLYLLHAATGHCNTRHLIHALKRRGANEQILEFSKTVPLLHL